MEVNMNKVGSENLESKSCRFDSHLNHDNSEWLAQNSKEMDQNVKQIMKLMEDDIEVVTKGDDEMDSRIKSEVIVQVQELYRTYQSLAERYDHLTGELRKSVNKNSPLVTPDKKMATCKSVQQASSLSSGGDHSEMSLKEGTDSSSFSSDSDSESFSSSANIYLNSPSEVPAMEEKIQVDADDKLKIGVNRSFGELVERLTKCEEELRESNLKLHLAEEEIVRLNAELKKSESFAVLAENMVVHLESLQRDLELEKGKVLELQRQIVELEANVSDSNSEVTRLMNELGASEEKVKSSEDDMAMLEAHLDKERRQVVNLQEQVSSYRNDISNRGCEVEELKGALCDAQDNFSMQKASFQSEIFGLLEKETLLESRLKEWELYGRDLEAKIRQCETEKMVIKDSYDVQEINLQGQISQLRAELNEKGVHVEALNKNLDKMKFKYDMLMAEKDELIAKVNNYVAEARSRDLQIGQMEEHLQQQSREHLQLISGSKQAKNLEDELKSKVKDLEKEVDRQRTMILDVAEEKREVIRQLSFTLEHYRSGYKEFQAFLKHKRYAVMAS